MFKRKINVNMQGFNLPNEGTLVYANELLLRLMNYEDLEINGSVPRLGLFHSCFNPEEYKRFIFPIKSTRFPEWMVNNQVLSLPYKIMKGIAMPFIRNYNNWVGDNTSDVFMFFINSQAPQIITKGKVVSCIHDITPFRVPETFTPDFLALHKKAFENACGKSTKIITDSEFSKKDIIDFTHMDENKIDVVYCGVNSEYFSKRQNNLDNVRIKYALPDKYILYFGTCRPHKNVESVINAYVHLPEATRREYALVITNPKEVTKFCAMKNNVAPHYIENVSEEDKPAIYQMASVMVWLSLYEGFGLPIIEAQSAGTPVVCSNVTSLPEVAGDAAVLVDPLDTETTVDAIERCLHDEPFRQDLIAKGHENIKRFSWDESAKRLHDIIMSL